MRFPSILLACLGALAFSHAGPAQTRSPSPSPVVISEFLARNANGLADEDGDHPDWIELRNVSATGVNLLGWSLTDRRDTPSRWRFPSTNLPAHGFLLVFASGKNRSLPGRPLHTGFRIDGDGGYLALFQPDGTTPASEFAAYPAQFDDTSYGSGIRATTTPLLTRGATARYLVPKDGSAGASWTQPSFDDTAWTPGRTGLGYVRTTALAGTTLHAYWPIREGSGTVASNHVAGGTHGLLRGAAWAADPTRGTVLDFNGRDSHVAAGSLPRMGLTTNFTWSFWYRQRSVPNGNAVVLGNRSGGAPGLQFIKFTPTHFEYYRDGNIGFIPYTIPGTHWHHLAVVKAGGALTYYDNGNQIGSSRAGGDIEANPRFWGGDPGAPGEYADGQIDDISLWNTALTPEQVRSLHGGTDPAWLGGLGGSVDTDLGPRMHGANATAYIRIPFVAPANLHPTTLQLRIQYEDGFIAHLNGVEIARRNAPPSPAWNSTANTDRPAAEGRTFETIEVPAGIEALSAGTNILAIHGLNHRPDDPDFLILPELEATEETRLGDRYFDIPSPGSVNADGVAGYVENTRFDQPRGFHDTPFQLTLSCPTPGATIRYTTNGTEPTSDHGLLYQSPVRIQGTTIVRAGAFKADHRTRQTSTRSYLFLDQILRQTGAGLPNAWGNDWQMDPRVVTHPAYADRIREDMKSLPVLSLALDPAGFWGPDGIYTQSTGRGDEYERPCSAELFFPDGSNPGFEILCGAQIVGGASRTMTPKRGIGLSFKRRYGPPKLRYRFFPDSPVDSFDFIALRPNFNMSWVRTDNSGPLNNANADGAERLHAIYVRDQFTKESQHAMGQPGAHERFVHLYINGIYWGLYNPSERTDASFAASYLGGEKEDYDAIFSDPSTVARPHDGDKVAWSEMMAIARQGLSGSDAYTRIQQYLDVTNLADYMMLNFYCATVDWPWQNWNAARKREPGAQFKFFIWDADYTLETPPWVPDDRTDVGAASSDADSPARLYHELRRNPEWRLLFADRARKHFFHDGALTPGQTIPRFLHLCDTIDRAIVGESARWGDVVRRAQPYTRDVEWLTEKNRLLTQFFPQRTDRVIQQFIRAGLYPALPAVDPDHPGGTYTNTFPLTLHAPAGMIYYTTNGRDPRLPGGQVNPGALAYSGPIPIATNSVVMARAWLTNAWSALTASSFTLTLTPTPPPPPPPPTLTVETSGSALVIRWTSHTPDLTLEQTDDLTTATWTPVPDITGSSVTITPVEGTRTRFYRLRQP